MTINVENYIPMVKKMCLKYTSPGADYEDLVQEGCLGLMAAKRAYDPSKEIPFPVLARYHCRSYISMAVINTRTILRVSRTKAATKAMRNLHKYRKGEWLTESEAKVAADELKISLEDVWDMECELVRPSVNLDATISDESETSTMHDICGVSDDTEDKLIDSIDNLKVVQSLSESISKLPEKWSKVLNMRTLSDEPRTLKEVSSSLGISIERARQIEKQALDKLKVMHQDLVIC